MTTLGRIWSQHVPTKQRYAASHPRMCPCPTDYAVSHPRMCPCPPDYTTSHPRKGHLSTRLHEVIPKDSHCILGYMVSLPITGNYHTAWCHMYCTISDSLQNSRLDDVTYQKTPIIMFTATRNLDCQAGSSGDILLV
jgi:hypothetical protein